MMDHDYTKKPVANKSRKYTGYCCIPQCSIYGEPGISFHLLPKNSVRKKKWEFALRMCRPSTVGMRVCSRHFLPTDFIPNAKRRKLLPHAVPSQNIPRRRLRYVVQVPLPKKITAQDCKGYIKETKNIRIEKVVATEASRQLIKNAKYADNDAHEVEIDIENAGQHHLVQKKIKMAAKNQDEMKVCRVCLAVDVKMYDMKDFKLNEMFTKITGIAVRDNTESARNHVCWECSARLTAASAFRDKALLSDALLKDLVHINKREIEQLKQCCRQLKPTLTIQAVFTSADMETGNTIPQQESPSAKPKKKKVCKRNRKRKTNIYLEEEKTVFDTEEPLIGIPIKTEIEFDPIAENDVNIQIKQERSETFAELTNFDDSSMSQDDEIEDEISNNGEQIDNYDRREDIPNSNVIIKEEIDIEDDHNEQEQMLDGIENNFDATSSEVSKMNVGPNDSDIVLEESAKEPPTLDAGENVFDDYSSEDTEIAIEPSDDSDIDLAEDDVEDPTLDDTDESSSDVDTESLAELASVKKDKKQATKKGGAFNKGPNSLSDMDKRKIIALKEKGMSMPEIAEATGKTESCITDWWQRYTQEDSDNQEDCTAGDGTKQNDRGRSSNLVDFYPPHVIRKLTEVGFEHLLKKNLDDKNTGQKKSKFGPKSESLKRQIVALKEAGLTTSHTAHLLGTTRASVRVWWNRWRNEGVLTERKRKPNRRKTTAAEDQLILDRVTQSESVHIPSLAKEFGISSVALRSRLKTAGFKRQLRGPYIPLNEGRTKKVDEELKQKILTMRQNGVPVTEIAMKCRVPRTTIYQWWRRWCKENNVKSSNKDTNDASEEGRSLTEDAKNQKTERMTKNLSLKKALYTKVEDTEISKKKPE